LPQLFSTADKDGPFLSPLSPASETSLKSQSHPEDTQGNGVLLRPAIFTGIVFFGSFGAVGIWQYEQQLRREKSSFASFWAQRLNQQQWWRIPPALRQRLSANIISLIEDITNDHRATTIGPIIAANVAVFSAFSLAAILRSSRVLNLFGHFFIHRTGSGQVLPFVA